MWRKPPLAVLPKDKKPALAELAGYPDMTGWFDPGLLGKLLLRVIISDVFGQYADRRLIEAALDTQPKEELQNRDDLTSILTPDASGAIWIDYVADLADGFDATYAVPYLIAQKSLTLDDVTLPRGGALFMGGDEVYPTASRDEYNAKLRAPYQFALPSRTLLKGDLGFPISNWKFSLLLGAIYSIFGFVLSLVPRADLAVIFFAIFAAGFVSYSAYQEKGSRKAIQLSVAHAIVHFAALLILTSLWTWLDFRMFSLQDGPWWAWLTEFLIFMVPIGGGIAGFIFGFNLLFTCKYADLNHNDAFSAMRLDSFRHFLRIRVIGDQITVYPVGFDRTPRREEWRDNPAINQDPQASYFLPG